MLNKIYDVDKDMLEQFANFIDSVYSKIIFMHQEGDAAEKLELFKRPAEKVLRELKSDIQLPGCQHFAFSFQPAQLRIGEGKFPVSL